MDKEEWLKYGIENGFCSPPVCSTHDGIPQSDAEDFEWADGGDPCIHIIRPYADDDEKLRVEANFAPAVWRKKGFIDANI